MSEIGCTSTTELDIKLSDDTPVVYRPYHLSHIEKKKKAIKDLYLLPRIDDQLDLHNGNIFFSYLLICLMVIIKSLLKRTVNIDHT